MIKWLSPSYPTYTPTKIIKTLEKYGALRAQPPNPLKRLETCLTLNAAIVPDNTIVNANPTLNPSTKVAPRSLSDYKAN